MILPQSRPFLACPIKAFWKHCSESSTSASSPSALLVGLVHYNIIPIPAYTHTPHSKWSCLGSPFLACPIKALRLKALLWVFYLGVSLPPSSALLVGLVHYNIIPIPASTHTSLTEWSCLGSPFLACPIKAFWKHCSESSNSASSPSALLVGLVYYNILPIQAKLYTHSTHWMILIG